MLSPTSPDRIRTHIGAIALILLGTVTAIAVWQTQDRTAVQFERESDSMMGTESRIAVFGDPARQSQIEKAMTDAEAALRRVESRMSRHIERSEISLLNAAPANDPVPLTPDTLTALRKARTAWDDTAGAFDATCGPLIALWIEAGRTGELPAAREIEMAREASNWSDFELLDDKAIKRKSTARVDLGAIAKGYAIDQALEALKACKPLGGMIDVGGDLACFGAPSPGANWTVEVRDPFQRGASLGSFEIEEGAVCTSGNYARFVEIDGRRYSHILDPRAGRPADGVPSVTVHAPNAMQADIWATALSVLGAEGFALLPENVEAMLIQGDADSWSMAHSAGFPEFQPETVSGETR